MLIKFAYTHTLIYNHSPQRLFLCKGEVAIGSGLIDGYRWALRGTGHDASATGNDKMKAWVNTHTHTHTHTHLDLVAPASKVSKRLNGHANVCFQGQSINGTRVNRLNSCQLLLVFLHQVSQTTHKRSQKVPILLKIKYAQQELLWEINSRSNDHTVLLFVLQMSLAFHIYVKYWPSSSKSTKLSNTSYR